MNEKIKRTTAGIRGFIVRIIPALLLVSALFYGLGSVYARMLLPVFAFEIALFHPEYEIVSYGTEENQIEGNSIYYTVKITRPIINKAGIPLYDKEVKLNTVASVLYIQPIIVFSLLLSWPALSLKERGWGLLISVPLMIAAASIDIPVYLHLSDRECIPDRFPVRTDADHAEQLSQQWRVGSSSRCSLPSRRWG